MKTELDQFMASHRHDIALAGGISGLTPLAKTLRKTLADVLFVPESKAGKQIPKLIAEVRAAGSKADPEAAARYEEFAKELESRFQKAAKINKVALKVFDQNLMDGIAKLEKGQP